MHRRIALAVAAVVAAFAAPPAFATGLPTRALAADGDVFQITQGRYGELFPDGAATLPEDPVLALTVIHSNGASERLLVPQTAGPEVEELSSLVLGAEGDSLHVLWQSGAAGARLRLASLVGGTWSEVVDVSRAVPVLNGSTRAAVTRDRSELAGEGGEGPARLDRSVLHVVWSAEAGGSVIYAPLVLEDGVYVGDHALYGLDQLVAGPVGGEAGARSEGAALAPAVEPGDGGSAVVAFTDPQTGWLVTLELRMVAGELSDVGNRLRDRILDLTDELEPGAPDSLEQLAGGARAQVINVGRRLQPALVQLLAAEIERYVLETGGDWAFQPEAMAERTRRELLAIGAAFDHAPVQRLAGGARAQVINVGQRWEGPLASHDLRLRVTAERPTPVLPEGVAGILFLSADGEDALVAWEVDGAIYFRETDVDAEDGWGSVSALGISAGEDPSLVRDLLRERVRQR